MLRHIPHLVHPPIAAQRLWPLPRTTYINFSTAMRAQCTNQNRQSDAPQQGKRERRNFSFSSMQHRRRMGELSDLANRGGRSSSPYERHTSFVCRGRDRTLRERKVTGGEVVKASRLEQGKNIRWEIAVQPSANADVTIVLPVTTDCVSREAICAGDGRMLSQRVELTVSGPSG